MQVGWFREDGAHAYFAVPVAEYWNDVFADS